MISGIPPGPVTVNATFYNHTQGPLTNKAYSGISGQSLVIKISDVYASNADYDIFLMNTSAGANYQLIDEWVDKRGGILLCPPDAKWSRQDLDGKTGPEAPINTVIGDLNYALNYPWKKYGSLTQVSSGGNIGVGNNNSGYWHSGTWAGVPYDAPTDYARLTGFNEEIFELITQTDDIDGQSTRLVICDGAGRLNAIGRDFLAYVYVKDSKIPSSGSSSKFSFGFH